MKFINQISCALLLGTLALASCQEEESPSQGSLALDREEIVVGPEGGVETVHVSAGETVEWVASASQPFVYITPANGTGSAETRFSVDSTLDARARNAQVRITTSNGERRTVNITQFGYGRQILPATPEVEIESSGLYDTRYIRVKVTTNVPFTVDDTVDYSLGEALQPGDETLLTETDRSNWVRIDETQLPDEEQQKAELDRKERPRTFEIRIPWNMNTIPYTRVAKIRLRPIDPEVALEDQEGNPTGEVYLTIRQKAAQRITDDRAGDSLAVIIINEKLQSMLTWDTSENMSNWDAVTLWEETDKDKPSPEAVGRVRAVNFAMFDLREGETLPREIRYLKYLEELTLQSNTNRQFREMELGEEVCGLKHLKRLTVSSYGLVRLPKGFAQLGSTLETLDLGGNNFANLSEVTQSVNRNNFPRLRRLNLSTTRRDDTTKDLAAADPTSLTSGKLGMYTNLNANKWSLIELLQWEELEELELSYSLFEGALPSDEEMAGAGFRTYAEIPDAEERYPLLKDTCRWLLTSSRAVELPGMEREIYGDEVLCVLPNARKFSINLNFLTGDLPAWILLHPHLQEWNPESMVFNQWEEGKDSQGNAVGFDNIKNNPDFNFGYYYGNGRASDRNQAAYPMYYNKHVGGGETGGTWPDGVNP